MSTLVDVKVEVAEDIPALFILRAPDDHFYKVIHPFTIAVIRHESYLKAFVVFLHHPLRIFSNLTDHLRKTATGETKLPIF